MANRPSVVPSWTDGDPVKVVQPPQAQINAGFVPGEPAIAQYCNWLFANISNWIQYLDQGAAAQSTAPALLTNGRIINAGQWSFVASSGNFAWSTPFNLAFPGVPDTANTVATGSVTLLDGQAAYINVNLPVNIVATATSGSNQLTNVASTQGISVGQSVSGPGLPAGLTVTAINGNIVTMSGAASSSQAAVTYTFFASTAPTMQVADAASLVVGPTTAVIARRYGSVVGLGLNTTEAVLRDGEFKTLRNGGYAYLQSGTAGQALTDRQAVHMGQGTTGRTSGLIYPAEASEANGAARSQFLGFTLGAAASGAAARVVCGGIMGGFSGLTPGAQYYLDPVTPGAITTARTSTSGQFMVPVGLAMSATSLLVTPPGTYQGERAVNQAFKGAVTAASIGAFTGPSLGLTSSLIPDGNKTRDIGSAANAIANAYIDKVLSNILQLMTLQCSSFTAYPANQPHVFEQSILPKNTADKALGSPDQRWLAGYIDSLYTTQVRFPVGSTNAFIPADTLTPASGTSTIGGGSSTNPVYWSHAYIDQLHATRLRNNCISGMQAYNQTTTTGATNVNFPFNTALVDASGRTGAMPCLFTAPFDGFISSISASVVHTDTLARSTTISIFATVVPFSGNAYTLTLLNNATMPSSAVPITFSNGYGETINTFTAGAKITFSITVGTTRGSAFAATLICNVRS